MSYYDWRVGMYYADDVKPPKTPGGLAIQTCHAGEPSRDMEIRAAKSRSDLGKIVVWSTDGTQQTVWVKDLAGVWMQT